jgi:hypothetical protein
VRSADELRHIIKKSLIIRIEPYLVATGSVRVRQRRKGDLVTAAMMSSALILRIADGRSGQTHTDKLRALKNSSYSRQ